MCIRDRRWCVLPSDAAYGAEIVHGHIRTARTPSRAPRCPQSTRKPNPRSAVPIPGAFSGIGIYRSNLKHTLLVSYLLLHVIESRARSRRAVTENQVRGIYPLTRFPSLLDVLFCKFADSYIAVSYTHLDVYKRQDQLHTVSNHSQIQRQRDTHPLDFPAPQSDEYQHARSFQIRHTKAVSYTHLNP